MLYYMQRGAFRGVILLILARHVFFVISCGYSDIHAVNIPESRIDCSMDIRWKRYMNI